MQLSRRGRAGLVRHRLRQTIASLAFDYLCLDPSRLNSLKIHLITSVSFHSTSLAPLDLYILHPLRSRRVSPVFCRAGVVGFWRSKDVVDWSATQ